MERTFDRIVGPDPRNSDYPIRPLLAATPRPLRSYSWRHIQLDQGAEGACVGFATTMEAAARPKPWFGDPIHDLASGKDRAALATMDRVARENYHRAQAIDPWANQPHEGTTVTAGMQIGRANGYWSEYRWPTGTPEQQVEDVMLSIAYFGPAVLGCNWWTGMDRGGDDMAPTGRVRGGHCIMLSAVSLKRDAVWTPNSWGGASQGWISRRSLSRLIAEDGEVAIPVSRRMPA